MVPSVGMVGAVVNGAPDTPLEARNAGAQSGAKTLDNGLRVLRLIAEHPDGLTVTEIATRTQLHRTVVYRLLLTLAAHGMVVHAANGKYLTGLGLTQLAGKVRKDLRSIAREPLRRLAEATDATAHLTVADGGDAVSLAVVEPVDVVAHVAYREGFRHPLTKGAAGLAILLAQPSRPGERTLIKRARQVGYVATHGELETGAWGLAAPVRVPGRDVTSAVGIVALSALDVGVVAPHVLSTAAEVARGIP